MRLAVAIFVGCFLVGIGKFQETIKLKPIGDLGALHLCKQCSWVLADLFPAKKKITVFKAIKPEQIYKTDNIFYSKLVILSDNSCHF